MLTLLYKLHAGDKFIWNNRRFTVVQKEAPMIEVFCKATERYYAWPYKASVQQTIPPTV